MKLEKSMRKVHTNVLAQHFSMLKELRTYCDEFSQGVENENNLEEIWKAFKKMQQVLDSSMSFLNFPI